MLRRNEPPDRKETGERWVKWFLQDPDLEMSWGGLNLDKMMMPQLEVFKTWTKSEEWLPTGNSVSQHLLQQLCVAATIKPSQRLSSPLADSAVHTSYPARPGSYIPESVLVNLQRHSIIYTQPSFPKDLSGFLRSPKNCLSQIFLGNLGSSALKQAIISLPADPETWSLRAAPWKWEVILPCRLPSEQQESHSMTPPTSIPKTKIPCWVPYFRATNIIH